MQGDLALAAGWVVIRPIVIQHSPPHCERQSRPPRVSGEGVTGESGPLICFLQAGANDCGPAALMRRPTTTQVIQAGGTSPSGAMIEHPTLSFLTGAGGASFNRNP